MIKKKFIIFEEVSFIEKTKILKKIAEVNFKVEIF